MKNWTSKSKIFPFSSFFILFHPFSYFFILFHTFSSFFILFHTFYPNFYLFFPFFKENIPLKNMLYHPYNLVYYYIVPVVWISSSSRTSMKHNNRFSSGQSTHLPVQSVYITHLKYQDKSAHDTKLIFLKTTTITKQRCGNKNI